MPVHHRPVSPRHAGLLPLLLLAPALAGATETASSPFASWAADVASPAARTAAPFLGRALRVEQDGLVRLDRSRLLHAALDVSGPLVGADRARTDGRTGRGVLIAVIDSGVDFSHPAFLDADGVPRILWYLDMTLPSRGLAGTLDDLGFALFARDDLARALRDPAAPRPSPDAAGHGTRVASIAAGSRLPYLGIAPDAELLVVRADRLPGGRYDEADVADALGFVFAVADRLGRPCVVNLSLGGQAGAHDGTSWLERAIDAAAWEGPGGRAVVVAAGNDADSAVHAVLDPGDAGSASTALVIPTHRGLADDASAYVAVDLWSAPGAAFALEVTLPDGTVVAVDADSPSAERPLDGGGALRVELGTPAARDGIRTEALAAWTGGDDGTIPPGRYTLRIHGHAPVDAWLSVEARASLLPFRLERELHRDTTLAVPATAHGAIAVGALVGRASWTNHLGDLLVDPDVVGEPAPFSSLGPTADGRFKPDLLAPGAWVIGAQSSTAELPLGPGGFPATASDPQWAAGRGTSLAAPHVAGAIALLLQNDPWLHPREILARLRATARTDAAWREDAGFGLLDAYTALRAPPPLDDGDNPHVLASVARATVRAGIAAATEVAFGLRAADGSPRAADEMTVVAAVPLRLEVPDAAEPALRSVDVSRLAPGSCAEVTGRAPENGLSATVTICAASRPATGCSVAAGSRSRPLAAMLLGLMAVALARRNGTRGVDGRPPANARGLPPRRWPFVFASVAVHALLLAPLAFVMPGSPLALRDPVVAVSLLAAAEPDPIPVAAPLPVPLASVPVKASAPAAVPVPAPQPASRESASRARRAATRSAGAAATAGLSSLPIDDGAGTFAATTVDGNAEPGTAQSVAAAVPPVVPDVSPGPDPCRVAAAQLRAAVDRQTRYPPLARRRRVVGTTVVSFTLAANGALQEARVATSSGTALLDAAALAAVRDAAPYPVGGCRFELPVRFSLAE
jgi:TonB family protein